MKIVRVLSRLAVLSVAAAAFVGLTRFYGVSVQVPLPEARWREGRAHRPSAPEFGRFPEVIGEVLAVVIFAAAGRIVLRLRLSPESRSKGQLTFLNLHERNKNSHTSNLRAR